GIIELYFVRTEYQLADMFTKALPEDRFQYLVRQIGMRCLTLVELEVLPQSKPNSSRFLQRHSYPEDLVVIPSCLDSSSSSSTVSEDKE
ncbi:hypothetical protein Tco_0962111, partial [Tanacetum coccineum]